MQPERSESSCWLVGKSRRERVVSFLAVVFGCLGFIWGMINDMSYGYEGAEGPSRLHTNGRFDESIVLAVFFSCVAACLFCVLTFWYFRLLDKCRSDKAYPCSAANAAQARRR